MNYKTRSYLRVEMTGIVFRTAEFYFASFPTWLRYQKDHPKSISSIFHLNSIKPSKPGGFLPKTWRAEPEYKV